MLNNIGNIDHIFYINLERRPDRRSEIEAECKKMDLQCERIDAIPHFVGGVGCGLSHVKALKLAKKRGYKNVLILEDDFEFLVERKELDKQIEHLFQDNPDFDICFLAYNLQEFQPLENNHHFVKALYTKTSSAYIINEKMYDSIIDLFLYSSHMYARGNEHWNYSIDVMWNQVFHLYNVFCFKKRIGKQRASLSDITERYENYGL